MRFIQRNSGFTVLELMLVVLLIGILSTIAKTSYRKFAARARQAEAKVALGAIYSMEQAFFVEQNSYTFCLKQIGYEPSRGKRYYSTGYAGSPQNLCGPDGSEYCAAYSFSPAVLCEVSCSYFDSHPETGDDSTTTATAKISASAVLINSCSNQVGAPQDWVATRNLFTAGAAGNISDSNTYDLWQIDQSRRLINIRSGI